MQKLLKLLTCLWLVIAYRGRKIAVIVAILALCILAGRAYALDPGTFDITIWANEDFALNLTHKANGIPINLTGYSFKLQGKKTGAAAAFVTMSSSLVDAAAGKTRHRMSRRYTADRMNTAGNYDLMRTAPDGTVTYRLMGTIKIRETNTR